MVGMRTLTAAAIVVALAGCASGTISQDRSALPGWTTQTQFADADRQVFVGIGTAASESEAKRRAQSDAQAQFIRAVGGIVVTSQRIVEAESSDDDGISRRSVSSERYTGSTSAALLHSTESEFAVIRGRESVTVYVRMSVPTHVLESAREEVKRRHEQSIARQIEARKLAQKSRSGDVNGSVYALAVEQASVRRKQGVTDIATERKAREKARHIAKLSVTEQVHGQTVKSVTSQSGSRFNSSYTASSGLVRSEIVAERVWWEGESAVAESYVLGWKN